MNRQTVIGLLILLLCLGAFALWQHNAANRDDANQNAGDPAARGPEQNLHAIKGKAGGEKTGFCHDPEVLKILEKRYKINSLDAIESGSIAMLKGETENFDFFWPGSRSNVEVFHGKALLVASVFNSPIVIFSRAAVVDALMKPVSAASRPGDPPKALVEKIDDSYYVIDFAALASLIEANTKWSQVGLPQLNGSVKVIATDPALSNSGNAFAGLLANTFGGGETVELSQIDPILPRVKAQFAKIGRLEHGSGALFEGYLKQGMGAFPLVVGYESQLVELVLNRPAEYEAIKREMRVLYPRPTTWSDHPIICLTEGGKRFAEALRDPDIQKIAWERHGFRVGLAMQVNLSPTIREIGLAPSIDSVVAMPANDVMSRILESLSTR